MVSAPLIAFLALIIHLAIIAGVIYLIVLIVNWAKQMKALKQEHNDLLKEIIKKMNTPAS